MKVETDLLREVGNWLHEQKYFFWRSNNIPAAGRRLGVYRTLPKYTPAGLPDFFIVWRGHVIGIECKRREGGIDGKQREANGRIVREGLLSPEQAEFGVELVTNGGQYSVVRSLQDLKDFLDTVE